MRPLLIAITMMLLSSLLAAAAPQVSCQKQGGIDCAACCAQPLGAANTLACCQPAACIERIAAATTFPGLGEVRVERLPSGSYLVWYGEKDAVFGARPFVEAHQKENGEYQFTLKGSTHSFRVREGTCSVDIIPLERKESGCALDFSCEAYFIIVPVDGSWPSQRLFEREAANRAAFFQDISSFRERSTGFLFMPLSFTAGNCDVARVKENLKDRSSHQRIKDCADRYAQSLGIGYERAIGFSNSYGPGRTFFGYKAVWASRGYGQQDRPGLVAHELGHTYHLCDEYSYAEYATQDQFFRGDTCRNDFPANCGPAEQYCQGSTPTYRDYRGRPLDGACQSLPAYSVMGWSLANECGFDATGGYEAIR